MLRVNKASFSSQFLDPLCKIRPTFCVLDGDPDKPGELTSVVMEDSQNMSLYARYRTKQLQDFTTIGIRNTERFLKALAFVPDEEMTFQWDDRSLHYDGKTVKFYTPLMAPQFVDKLRLGLKGSKFDEFEFDCCFDMPTKSIEQVIRGRQFAADADALVLQQKGDVVTGTLVTNDAELTNNSITFDLASADCKLKGKYKISLDVFSLMSPMSGMKVLVNQAKAGLLFVSQSDDAVLKYGVRTLA